MKADSTARWASSAGAIVIALAAIACGGGDGGNGDDVPDLRQTVAELPATPNRDLDLLLVIDDSPGMLERQTELKNDLRLLLDGLAAVPGGLPNLHIGVISTDMGTKASGSPTPGPATGQIGQGGCSGTGKGGALQLGFATAEVTGPFVIDVEAAGGGRTKNYTGDLLITLSKMLTLGSGGCGFEQPLAAMRASLDNHPMNTGFLRPEALLGVFFLADEDDCSAKSTQLWAPESPLLGPLQSFRCTQFGVTCGVGGETPDAMKQVGAKSECGVNASSQIIDDVTPFRDFLVGLKGGDARRVVLGGILGPAEPLAVELRQPPGGGAQIPGLGHVCTDMMPTLVADPAPRMRDFLSRFPDRERFASICGPDLAPSVTRITELLRRAIGTGCVEDRLADTDPKTAGVQADCIALDLAGTGEAAAATRIEACADKPDARPCWRLEEDLARCAAAPAPHLGLVVERDGAAAPGTVTRVRCQAER
ncbi:MAG TPA: hypothetical protein VNO30_37255 [Kofleriaceae bacterium]|nr:hypothetical protein [Kofleriaceae bacterium]